MATEGCIITRWGLPGKKKMFTYDALGKHQLKQHNNGIKIFGGVE